jgi:hypothetical protein
MCNSELVPVDRGGAGDVPVSSFGGAVDDAKDPIAREPPPPPRDGVVVVVAANVTSSTSIAMGDRGRGAIAVIVGRRNGRGSSAIESTSHTAAPA